MAVTPQTNTTLQAIADVLRKADDFVICGHVGPDGDCLGSQLALMHALKMMGKQATCLLVRDEALPESLSWLPGINDMVPSGDYDGPCATFVAVDVPLRSRIEQAACALLDGSSASVTIDHHAVDSVMTDYVYVDPAAASASMLVWQVVKLLCDKPPLESAICAYVGLVTDTGGFRFQNTDHNAFEVASELVAFGVDPSFVATKVFQNHNLASLKLEAMAIDHLRVVAEGKAAISWVSLSDFAMAGAAKSDAETLVDTVRSLAGVKVACVLREQADYIRVNLRSKDETDVSVLARKLGGGGHKAAAGITLKMSIEEALGVMSAELESLVG